MSDRRFKSTWCGLVILVGWIFAAGSFHAATRPDVPTVGQFKLTLMETGTTKDGAGFTRQTFEARDGEKVYSTKTHFESPDRSMKEFDEKLKNSKKVIERGKAVDKAGRAIGERAVLLTASDDGSDATLVIRTMGAYFTEIRSHSQRDALDFEKQFVRASAP